FSDKAFMLLGHYSYVRKDAGLRLLSGRHARATYYSTVLSPKPGCFYLTPGIAYSAKHCREHLLLMTLRNGLHVG
ncbi:hypothetical protein COCCADRAFT_111428, partial [Bipolaris zeicola 26-R-13]